MASCHENFARRRSKAALRLGASCRAPSHRSRSHSYFGGTRASPKTSLPGSDQRRDLARLRFRESGRERTGGLRGKQPGENEVKSDRWASNRKRTRSADTCFQSPLPRTRSGIAPTRSPASSTILLSLRSGARDGCGSPAAIAARSHRRPAIP